MYRPAKLPNILLEIWRPGIDCSRHAAAPECSAKGTGLLQIKSKHFDRVPQYGLALSKPPHHFKSPDHSHHPVKYAALSMSQSEYIRQAIFYSKITPVIRVTAHSEEMLTAVSSLVAQYGKIGSNLNQIARYLNEYGIPYNALSGEVRAAVSDLAALKFEVLKVIGEAYGNDKAYQF